MEHTSEVKATSGSRPPTRLAPVVSREGIMTSVLVVDDSSVDRQLVTGLLRTQSALEVHQAADGMKALDAIRQFAPDLIVTDMQMPEMDGIELVQTVREQFPEIPIVLMTGQGSEQLAVAALKNGAASYVPKSALQRDLTATVMNVLSVARTDEDHERMMLCVKTCRWEFELENDFNLVGPLIDLLGRALLDFGICREADRVQVGMALEAALSNAIYHGNLELSKDELDGMTYDLNNMDEPSIVEQRQQQSPYCDRRVSFTAELTSQDATFVIRDQGPGFDHASMPCEPSELLTSADDQGRGITHIRLFADEVRFNDAGNELTLVVRRKS